MKNTDLNKTLRTILGPKARFRNNQREILVDILNRTSVILAISPTGSGKSLFFQIPGLIDPLGVTIVILPLISLLFDQLKRAKKLNISSTIYDPRNPPDSVRLVFTTPETSLSESFQNFLSRLRTFHQLDRIIIDECHIILSKNSTFRKQLSQLGELLVFKTQIVLLTATLPPRYQSDLFNKLYIQESDVKIYRSLSNRVNIRYSVYIDRSEDEILSTIRQKSIQYQNDRLIVYTRTRQIADNLKKRLKWPIYYSNSPRKEQVLREFLDITRKNSRIIATSSLGLGLDIPNARAIFHIGRPYTLYEYAQESGRAGRDQISSESILFSNSISISTQSNQRFSRDEKFENTNIDQYMSSECRRYILSRYLDGSGSKCSEKDEKCDICKSISLFLLYILTYNSLFIGSSTEHYSNVQEIEELSENDLNISQNDDLEEEIDEIPQG